MVSRPANISRHIKTRHSPLTVEEILIVGNVDTSVGEDSCWMWRRGKMTPELYGKYRGDRAHRQMYRAAHGEIPTGADICHTCDRPGCVNPKHLWAGSRSENVRDAVAKGRITSPMRDPEVQARVAAKIPRGDEHHTRKNPDIAGTRVKAMLAARGIEYNREPVSQKEVMPK